MKFIALALLFTFVLGIALARIARAAWLGRARLQKPEARVPRRAGRKEIVIFYSSIGHGHISAAWAVRDEILRQDPTAIVLLQDIRAFMDPVRRRIDERLYWFVASNLPECFESLFRSVQVRGNRVPSLSLLPNDYPEEKVLAYLRSRMPHAILATHYGAAQVLGTLRERGLLAVKIGWLHTDFFEGYFPRISKRIDRTFLAHAELESRWLAAGVPSDKVTTSGMPVRIAADSRGDSHASLAHLGLAPDITTLLLTGGKEGACDYSGVVQSVARHCPGPLQIVGVCGNNARQRALLTALQTRLPSSVTLKVLGLLPHSEMVSYMRAANLLITKAGGVTPAEAFAMGTPTVLLDMAGGHERENAAMFARIGAAELVTDISQVGKIVSGILADPRRIEKMLSAQREFRQSVNVSRIAEFVLDESLVPVCPVPDLGIENGTGALGIEDALALLNHEAPADIELLLSYANSRSPQRFVIENPFGHLAIRIGGTVYSANYIAVREIDPNLLQHLTLGEYLYGVQRPSPSQVHASTYGMAYGRVTLGLRVAGVPLGRREKMAAQAARIEESFSQGTLRYDRKEFNCADVVAQILQVGGYCRGTPLKRLGLPTMPLDVFEQARAAFENDDSLQVDLVAYRQVPGSQASCQFSRFPLSISQPLRSVARVLDDTPRDPLEAAVRKQVTAYFGDRRLYVESLQARRTASGLDDHALLAQAQLTPEEAIAADLRRLLALTAKWPLREIERLGDSGVAREIGRLIDHGHDLARLATERAEEVLLHPQARRLRERFTQLAADYGRIGKRRLTAFQLNAYLDRLRAFASTAEEEYDAPASADVDRRTTTSGADDRLRVEPSHRADST